MRRICIFQEAMDASCHCIDDTFNGRGFADGTFEKFVPVKDDKEAMLIHAYCKLSLEGKHDGCNFDTEQNREWGYYDCCLAPQVKIKRLLPLNNEGEKRICLRLMNEPFTLACYNYDNEKMLYASIAYHCNKDSIDYSLNSKFYISAICPACNDSYDTILNLHIQ